jgi:hypothetical protein
MTDDLCGKRQCVCRRCPAPCQVIGCGRHATHVVDEGDRAASEALGNVFDLYDFGTYACDACLSEVQSWCCVPVTITLAEHEAKMAAWRAEMQAGIDGAELMLAHARAGNPIASGDE